MLHDWLSVMQYFDSNQPISQQDIIKLALNTSQAGSVTFLAEVTDSHTL
jgi:hypothetical protein